MIAEPFKKIELVAENLIVGYDSKIALELEALHCSGNIIALVGPNGSGKSTFMKTLLSLLIPQRGSLKAKFRREDQTSGQLLIPEHDMAYSPEENAIFSDLVVSDYLKLWCRLKLPHANYHLEEGISYLNDFHLLPLLNKRGRELSKGQRRRLQAALGFLIQPKFFLLDEPFDGLDERQSNALIDQMYRHAPNTGLLVSTHRLDIVEKIADTVIFLDEEVAAVRVEERISGSIPG